MKQAANIYTCDCCGLRIIREKDPPQPINPLAAMMGQAQSVSIDRPPDGWLEMRLTWAEIVRHEDNEGNGEGQPIPGASKADYIHACSEPCAVTVIARYWPRLVTFGQGEVSTDGTVHDVEAEPEPELDIGPGKAQRRRP